MGTRQWSTRQESMLTVKWVRVIGEELGALADTLSHFLLEFRALPTFSICDVKQRGTWKLKKTTVNCLYLAEIEKWVKHVKLYDLTNHTEWFQRFRMLQLDRVGTASKSIVQFRGLKTSQSVQA